MTPQPSEQGQEAFDRAVARERASILAHEQAAALHERVAERAVARSQTASAPAMRNAFLRAAEVSRHRAQGARFRANQVRRRLRSENVSLDADGM